MTSTYADVYFKTSIKDGTGNPAEPPEDVYAQLTELVKSGILKGDDGLTPYIGENNNWWIGDIDTGVLARGTDGEDGYTPVKGIDYFTEEEIQQIQNEVSGGAIGDFKAVVDEKTATFNTIAENTLTDYNANAQEKFNTYNTNADSKFETYNTNAETKFSGYNTNAEAKLSEYNKNDLDKTALYNTNADSKFTTYNENAETKFSEYTSNAETKLSEYNQNDSDKTALYNANAENKLSAYGSNAQAKLDLYNQNDSEKTEAYNNNAQTKLAAYNENADNRVAEFNAQTKQIQSQIDNKFEAYNTNAETKFSEYNSNAESKVAVYNQNAETKTAEFDSNAAALQTEVDRLRGECDTLASENRKQENRISAILKLNKGQTYDILPEEGETASRTAPSGAKYVSVDKVGGKSIVWNQLNNPALNINVQKGAIKLNDDGSITISGTVQDAGKYRELQISQSLVFMRNQKYLVRTNKILSICVNGHDKSTTDALLYAGASDWTGYVALGVDNGDEVNIEELSVQVYNLTQMFGAGNEPTIEQFKKLFVQKIYPYNPGEIISSRTATITAGAETITTGFPELRSAGTAHDEIDMDGGQVIRNVYSVEIDTLKWQKNADNRFSAALPAKAKANGYYDTANNELCNKYESIPMNDVFDKNVGIATHSTNGGTVWIFDSAYETPEQLVASLSGAVLHYELATPTTEPVTIPEPLTEWLPVEAGGTVTFRNADDSKQLAVPNAVSWVRKLNEVE